jgi:hypothetical protein
MSSDVRRGLEALIGREHVSEEYVRFRIRLLEAQVAACDAVRPRAEDTPHEPTFDPALLGRLFEELRSALPSEDLERLSAAVAAEPTLLDALARGAAGGPDEPFLTTLSERLAISREALLFFGRVLRAPFVAAAVQKTGTHHASPAQSSRLCPQCGSAPALAKLRREDRRRILFCSLCGEGWSFARLMCPFCGGRACERLSAPSDDVRWIETCDECRGYIKTVDEQKLGEDEVVLPLVEATSGLYLDLIAEKRGHQGPTYVALR